MDYTLQIGLWNSVFAVPTALVDRYLKLAGKEQLQVLLWMLRHPGEPATPQALAENLGTDPDTILDAFDYWVQEGLLSCRAGELSPAPQAQSTQPAAPSAPAPAPAPAAQAAPLPSKKRAVKPDTQHVLTRMQESEEIKFLLQEAEMTFGKTLSPSMTSTLVSMCDDYGLPVEVAVMIVHYAKNANKTTPSYIDAVARDWAESGITSLQAAEEKLQQLDQHRLAWDRVQAAAGMARRAPSKKEDECAYRWVYQWKFTKEMLTAAYERCVDRTSRFNISYIDKVLEDWHNKGIQNLQDLEQREAGWREEQGRTKSYDTSDLEELSHFDLPEEL
ncbi:MAG: DnaD domain protein [Acutalibacter sp.]|jgi:DnaD/phage-associated family protein